MKKFRSRLQSLCRLRDQQEQLARAHLASCQQHLRAAEQKTARLKQLVDSAAESMQLLFARNTGAETLNGTRALFHSRQKQLQVAVEKQQAAATVVAQALKEWHAKRSELKAIQNRLNSQLADHRRDAFLKEEQNQQESVAQALFRQASETSGATQS